MSMRTTTGTGLTAWSRRCMASLKEENERLRAALVAAPEPQDAEVDYLDWWHGWQQPALKGE